MKNYIELTMFGGDRIYIKSDTIASIRNISTGSTLTLINGNTIQVTESFHIIKNKIEKNEVYKSNENNQTV